MCTVWSKVFSAVHLIDGKHVIIPDYWWSGTDGCEGVRGRLLNYFVVIVTSSCYKMCGVPLDFGVFATLRDLQVLVSVCTFMFIYLFYRMPIVWLCL